MPSKEHIEAALRLLERIQQGGCEPYDALDLLLLVFAEFLGDMRLADVHFTRAELARRVAEAQIDGEEILSLIDGHIAYREIFDL